MSNCLVAGSTGAVLGALVNGGLSAAFGAASGAVGAAILDAAGHEGYSVLEATQMGAAGNAVMGATVGALVGCAIGSIGGAVCNDNDGDKSSANPCGFFVNAAVHVGSQTLGGLLGWAMLNGGDASTLMSLGQTAASLATGSVVTMIPASCLMLCVAVPLVLGALACVTANNDAEVGTTSLKA